jgi:DNA-binding response OmpR family regulator
MLTEETTLTKPAVLIIGKDDHAGRQLADQLHRAGCVVHTEEDVQQGVWRAMDTPPEVVVLDQDLPGADPWEICRQIRSELPPRGAPAFLLTPNGSRDGFAGPSSRAADESVADPARGKPWLDALLSWAHQVAPRPARISVSGLEMDLRKRLAALDGRDLGLTPTEFRLLWILAGEPGRVFERSQLTRWCHRGGQHGIRMRTIDVHVKSIRNKLGAQAGLVETVHGVGYRFRESPAAELDDGDRDAVCRPPIGTKPK